MNLTHRQVAYFIVAVALNLIAVFLFISLVFAAFTTGEGLASASQSFMAAGASAYSNAQDQAAQDPLLKQAGDFLESLGNKIRENVIGVMGLSKTVADRLIQSLEDDIDATKQAVVASASAVTGAVSSGGAELAKLA